MGNKRENIVWVIEVVFLAWIVLIIVDGMSGTFPLLTSLGGAIVFWLLMVMGILILADIRDLLEDDDEDEGEDEDEDEDEGEDLVEEEKVTEE
jgi:hypothetical protein